MDGFMALTDATSPPHAVASIRDPVAHADPVAPLAEQLAAPLEDAAVIVERIDAFDARRASLQREVRSSGSIDLCLNPRRRCRAMGAGFTSATQSTHSTRGVRLSIEKSAHRAR
jgi:hypothetical protein